MVAAPVVCAKAGAANSANIERTIALYIRTLQRQVQPDPAKRVCMLESIFQRRAKFKRQLERSLCVTLPETSRYAMRFRRESGRGPARYRNPAPRERTPAPYPWGVPIAAAD